MKTQMRIAPFTLVGLAALACAQPKLPDTPEAGWQRFSEALRLGDARTAWSSLSAETQVAASSRSKVVAEASKGLVKDDPSGMLFQSGIIPRKAGAVKVLSATATEATLEVTFPGGAQTVRMIREGTSWQVDLSEALRK